MSNVFGIFIAFLLMAYLLSRFMLWASGTILKQVSFQKRVTWIHLVAAALLVFLVFWANPDLTLNGFAEKIIVAVAVTLISYFVISYEEKLKSQPFGMAPEMDAPVGLGGFLYFFTFMISTFAPLSQAGRIGAAIRKSEENLPFLKENADWSNLVSVTWLLIGVYISAFCYAGIILRSEFRKETVGKVIAIMWAGGPGLSLVMNYVNNYYYNKIDPNLVRSADFGSQFIGTIILAAAWTAYLGKSKRVRNTYPQR
jgi:hypothetical protein